jgi:hypothetical protein
LLTIEVVVVGEVVVDAVVDEVIVVVLVGTIIDTGIEGAVLASEKFVSAFTIALFVELDDSSFVLFKLFALILDC